MAVNPPNWRKLASHQIYDKFLVCDDHFVENDFVKNSKRGLKVNAVPSTNLAALKETLPKSPLKNPEEPEVIDFNTNVVNTQDFTLPEPFFLCLTSPIKVFNEATVSEQNSENIISYSLAENWPFCKRSDPNINKCLLDATNQVRPYLAKGVPSLKIPSFEPLAIPKIILQQGTRALNFKAELSNVLAYGLTKYKFSRFDFDRPNMQFFCDATIPGLRLEGDYKVTGRILIAPIEGNGRFTAQIDNCNAFVYQKVEVQEIRGDEYLTPVFTNSSITVQKPRARLDGLFQGNEALNEATNKAINENVDVLFAELKPVVEQTLTNILEDILFKSLFVKVPYDQLYPK